MQKLLIVTYASAIPVCWLVEGIDFLVLAVATYVHGESQSSEM